MFRMKKPNQFLNRVAVLTILNCVAVVLSTRDPTQSLGMSGSLSDSSVDSELSKAWPEVKMGLTPMQMSSMSQVATLVIRT